MKIIKYRKSKNNQYILLLEDGSQIELYEETILKYELLIKKEINKNLKAIISDNKIYDCYYSAIKFLSFKKRSVQEIKDKLKNIGYEDKDIEYTIEKLNSQKYIDDYEYAKSFLKEKILTTSHGPNRIKNDLRKKGISEEIILHIMEQYNYEIQTEKINKIMDKIIRANNNKGNIYIKRKIYSDLCYQGFDKEIIDEMIETKEFKEEEDLKQKEEEKLRKKYSNKYNGTKLEYKIKEALKRKGLLNQD